MGKRGVLFCVSSLVGGAAFLFTPFPVENSYRLSSASVIEALRTATPENGKPPFYGYDVSVRSSAEGLVEWGPFGTNTVWCRARIEPLDHYSSRVLTSCTDAVPGEGATAAISRETTEFAFAEFVDATLLGRPMNYAKFATQSVGAAFQGIRGAEENALKEYAEMEAYEGATPPAVD